jgi:hypothetical protein
MTKAFRYTDEMLLYLSDNRALMTIGHLTELFNMKFETNKSWSGIRAICVKKRVLTGIDSCFKKGFTPWNKGKTGYMGANRTTFKAGNLPLNRLPVGSERIDARDGYVKVKIAEPDLWILKSRMVWEAHNGKIPAHHIVMFIDGNKLNASIENLELISRQELLRFNLNGYSKAAEELKPIVSAISKLEVVLFASRK